jgi:hypothetical protein
VQRFVHGPPQLIETAPPRRHHRHHPGAEATPELARVETDPAVLGGVHQVQGDDHREPQLEDLGDQEEVAAQVRGVGHHEHDVRTLHALQTAEEHVERQELVRRVRGQRVEAGQVDELRLGLSQAEEAEVLLHGHAGVVADLLAQAGEGVEEHAFAGVGIAHHQHQGLARRLLRHAGGGQAHSRRSTLSTAASLWRSDSE